MAQKQSVYWNPLLETLPREKLQALQLKKFRRIMEWAYEHSPFYRALYKSAGIKPGDILVTDMTDPDWEPIMKIAGGIVTNRGGRTCHAAIVAREMKKPCIVGTKIATQVLSDGDFVQVDAFKGIINIIKIS